MEQPRSHPETEADAKANKERKELRTAAYAIGCAFTSLASLGVVIHETGGIANPWDQQPPPSATAPAHPSIETQPVPQLNIPFSTPDTSQGVTQAQWDEQFRQGIDAPTIVTGEGVRWCKDVIYNIQPFNVSDLKVSIRGESGFKAAEVRDASGYYTRDNHGNKRIFVQVGYFGNPEDGRAASEVCSHESGHALVDGFLNSPQQKDKTTVNRSPSPVQPLVAAQKAYQAEIVASGMKVDGMYADDGNVLFSPIENWSYSSDGNRLNSSRMEASWNETFADSFSVMRNHGQELIRNLQTKNTNQINGAASEVVYQDILIMWGAYQQAHPGLSGDQLNKHFFQDGEKLVPHLSAIYQTVQQIRGTK